VADAGAQRRHAYAMLDWTRSTSEGTISRNNITQAETRSRRPIIDAAGHTNRWAETARARPRNVSESVIGVLISVAVSLYSSIAMQCSCTTPFCPGSRNLRPHLSDVPAIPSHFPPLHPALRLFALHTRRGPVAPPILHHHRKPAPHLGPKPTPFPSEMLCYRHVTPAHITAVSQVPHLPRMVASRSPIVSAHCKLPTARWDRLGGRTNKRPERRRHALSCSLRAGRSGNSEGGQTGGPRCGSLCLSCPLGTLDADHVPIVASTSSANI
jgi:hypothetical protein